VQVVLEHSGEHLPRGYIWSVGARSGSHRIDRCWPATRPQIGAVNAAKNNAGIVQDETRGVGLASHAVEDRVNAIVELARRDVATREAPDRRLVSEVTFDG
jgi:hypothetical protein